MAKMGRELIKHDLILQYSSIYEDYLKKKDGSSFWMVNTNKLVKFYQGIDGLKTGFTSKAGYCLTATGKWKGMRLISVVMGEPTQDERSKDTIALLNYGKSAYKINTIVESDKSLGTIQVELGKKSNANIEIKEDITDLAKINDEEKKYTYEMKLDKVSAPIKKGTKVGTLNVFIDGKDYMNTPIYIKEDVEKCSFWEISKRVFKTMIVGTK